MNKFLKYAILTGIFITPFIALYVSGSMFFPFITGKNFTFRIITEIIFGLYIILALRDSKYRPKPSFILWSFVTFVLITLIADLNGENPAKSLWSNFERMEGFVTIAHLFIFTLITGAVVNTEHLWEKLFNVSLLSSFIMSMYGFMQLSGLYNINQGGVRLDGTLGNATYLAIYAIFNLFIAGVLFVRRFNERWGDGSKIVMCVLSVILPIILFASSDKGSSVSDSFYIYSLILSAILSIVFVFMKRQWLYGLQFVILSVMLYHTATRGAILGFIGGLGLTALIIAIKDDKHKTLRKASFAVILAIIVLSGAFYSVRKQSWVTENPVLGRFASMSINDTKTQARGYVWPMALKGFKERPILGWGQENFNYVFNKYYDPRMYSQEPWFDRTHNVVLDWLINGGILGLLAYLSLFLSAIYALWKYGDLSLSEKAMFSGLMFAYFFHNIFVFDNIVSYILFATILAYLHFHTAKDRQVVDSDYINSIAPQGSVRGYFVIVLIIIATSYSVYTLNAKPMSANKTLIEGLTYGMRSNLSLELDSLKKAVGYNTFGNQEIREQILQLGLNAGTSNTYSSEDKAKIYSFARDEMEKMMKEAPNDARFPLFLGGMDNVYGNYVEAEKVLNRALELSPSKQSIMFEVVNSQIGQNKFDLALETAKKAFDLEQNYNDARVLYAYAAIYDGKYELAQSLFNEKYGNPFYPDDRIWRSYYAVKRYDLAAKVLEEKVKANPKDINSSVALSGMYVKLGRIVDAVKVVKQVEDLDSPQNKAQYENLIKEILSGKFSF